MTRIYINDTDLQTDQSYVTNIQHLARDYNLSTFQSFNGTNYHIYRNSIANMLVVSLVTYSTDPATLMLMQKIFDVFEGTLKIGYYAQLDSFDDSTDYTASVGSPTFANSTTRIEGYYSLGVTFNGTATTFANTLGSAVTPSSVDSKKMVLFINISETPTFTATVKAKTDANNYYSITFTQADLIQTNGSFYVVKKDISQTGTVTSIASVEYSFSWGSAFNSTFYLDNLYLTDSTEVYQYEVSLQNVKAEENHWNITRRQYELSYSKKNGQAQLPYTLNYTSGLSSTIPYDVTITGNTEKYRLSGLTFNVISGNISGVIIQNITKSQTASLSEYITSGSTTEFKDGKFYVNGNTTNNISGFLSENIDRNDQIRVVVQDGGAPTTLGISQTSNYYKFSSGTPSVPYARAMGFTMTRASNMSGGVYATSFFVSGIADGTFTWSGYKIWADIAVQSGSGIGASVVSGESSGYETYSITQGNIYYGWLDFYYPNGFPVLSSGSGYALIFKYSGLASGKPYFWASGSGATGGLFYPVDFMGGSGNEYTNGRRYVKVGQSGYLGNSGYWYEGTVSGDLAFGIYYKESGSNFNVSGTQTYYQLI